jgi:hypothetical protein
MAEQSQMRRTDIGDLDTERQTKSPSLHVSPASQKISSSIPENFTSAAVPGIEGVKNSDNVITIDDTDNTTGASDAVLPALSLNYIAALKQSELKSGDSFIDIPPKNNAIQISKESEFSSNMHRQYQTVAQAREPDRKVDPTQQAKNAFAWNTNFVPPHHFKIQAQTQTQSKNGVTPNDFAARNAPQRGRSFIPGQYPPNFHIPQQAVALATVQQHQAATNAAEHHLQWRINAHQGDARNDNAGSGMNRSQPQEMSLPNKIFQRDQLLEQYTSEIARRISGGSNPSNSDRDFSGLENSQNRVANAINERKRSLSESEYGGSHPAAHRSHHTETERRPLNAPMSAQVNRSNHDSELQGSRISSQAMDISETMDIALDEATEHDAARTSKTSSSGRRVDTPMTYLLKSMVMNRLSSWRRTL